jgi:hypothetical protein
MKTALSAILACIAITVSAAASPAVRIDATIATDGEHVVMRPSFIVQSGKQAKMTSDQHKQGKGPISELTCAVTATLLDNGSVDIQTVITQREGKKTDTLTGRIVAQLGKVAKLQVGELVLTATPSLAK